MVQTNEPHAADDRSEEPTWQPVAAVGAMTGVVAEQLADTRRMLELLEQARPGLTRARWCDAKAAKPRRNMSATFARLPTCC